MLVSRKHHLHIVIHPPWQFSLLTMYLIIYKKYNFSLSNDIISFEQMGPDYECKSKVSISTTFKNANP